jgi:thioredoxin-like negative regulator of GroEL
LPHARPRDRSRSRGRQARRRDRARQIDADSEQQLAAQYSIQSLPIVAVFRHGKPIVDFVGAHPAAVIGRFLDATIGEHGQAADAA